MKRAPKRFFRISIFLLTIFVCVYFFLHSSFFKIDKIDVTGVSLVSRQEVLELSGIKTGENIFKVNEQVAARAVELHPMVKKAQLLRHLPRKLEIQVTERVMWAIVPLPNGFLVIDSDGVCIDKVLHLPDGDYPVITLEPIPERIRLGQAVAPEGMGLIGKVWQGLSGDQRTRISDFHYAAGSQELIIYTEQGTEIKFGSADRLPEKLAGIRNVFQLENDFSESGTEILEYVDLRFSGQPVVKTRS